MQLRVDSKKWNWKEKITIRTANALLAVKRGFLLRANLPTNRNLARMSRAWVRILSVWNMHDFSIFDKEGTVGRKAEETLGYFQPFFLLPPLLVLLGLPTHTQCGPSFSYELFFCSTSSHRHILSLCNKVQFTGLHLQYSAQGRNVRLGFWQTFNEQSLG